MLARRFYLQLFFQIRANAVFYQVVSTICIHLLHIVFHLTSFLPSSRIAFTGAPFLVGMTSATLCPVNENEAYRIISFNRCSGR